eukprot:5888443-Amphidinium_carterae.1
MANFVPMLLAVVWWCRLLPLAWPPVVELFLWRRPLPLAWFRWVVVAFGPHRVLMPLGGNP